MDVQDDSGVNTSGWDAITAQLARVYGDREPSHWGTLIRYSLGGPDPLDGISAYRRDDPEPHWHFVTFGFSELYEKESPDPADSGYGFELTLRVARGADETEAPLWPLSFLNNLARYVFGSGNVFAPGDHMNLNGPIVLDQPSTVTAMAVAEDPELPAMETPNGSVRFLQVVGLTMDEYEAVLAWNTTGMLRLMQERSPLLITNVNRPSYLADEAFRAQVTARSREEGSSTGVIFNEETRWSTQKRLLRAAQTTITLGTRPARLVAAILEARLPHDRPFTLAGREQQVAFEPGPAAAVQADGGTLRLTVPAASLPALTAALRAAPGEHPVPALGALTLRIVPTIIRDQAGDPVQGVE
jgi:suppressor of fused